MAPMTMFVLSGTVSMEFTSKPTSIFLREAASAPLPLKKRGSPVWMTLPTLPVPAGSLSVRSFFCVSLNCISLVLSVPQRVGE